MKDKITSVSLILLAVFSLGLLAGASGAMYLDKHQSRHRPWGERPPGERTRPHIPRETGESGLTRFFERRMFDGLDLSEEQKTLIRPELESMAKEMHAVRLEFEPKLDAVVKNARGKVRSHLTPDQQTKFDEKKFIHRGRPGGKERFRGAGPMHNGGKRGERNEPQEGRPSPSRGLQRPE